MPLDRGARTNAAPAANAVSGANCPKDTSIALDVRGASLCASVDDRELPLERTLLHDWIERSARIVADYYGEFPAKLLLLRIESAPGGGVHGGRTTNDTGLLIQASVGRDTTAH